jgi:thiol-disulfide isomerase/thioredoxin
MSERPSNLPFWILGGLLVASMIGMAIGAGKLFDGHGSSSPLEGRAAPALSLPWATGAGADQGDRFALEGTRGRVVLLDFWASWCGPCRRSIPALNQVHERYGDRVEIVGVNVEDGVPRSVVQAAHRRFGADFPSVQDEGYAAQSAFEVNSIPTLVLIDRAGIVRWVTLGVPDPGEVGERIEEILSASP